MRDVPYIRLLRSTTDTGGGTSPPQTFTITVTPVPPSPQADAYAVDQSSVLTVPAPGVLANDFDLLGNPLTLQTAPVSGPSNGALVLNPDGSFTYTPAPGYLGTDTFTYLVDNGRGLTATADVTITVNSGVTPGALYLGTSGSSADNYDLSLSPPPAAVPVPDFDSDGDPGITIKEGGGQENESDARRRQFWTYAPSTPLSLNGPVSLHFWSSIKDFDVGKDGHPHAYLYDCAAGGTACVKIADNQLLLHNWNAGPTWTEHTIVVGSVSRTIGVGRELRFRLQETREDLWVAMTAAYPSHLDVTYANAAPVANPDTTTVLEDSPATNLAVLANDTDANLAPATVAIVTPPTIGTATPLGDGTIDYTPTPDADGTDTLTYRVCDTGTLCANTTVTITIDPVNDAPTFATGPAQTTLEDAGPQSVPVWASAMSPGPANESGQSVSFSVTSDNPSLFTATPAIAPDGTLTYTPAADEFGTATVTVRIVDDGGTANGGTDTSPPQTFTITVTGVNDAPSFTTPPFVVALGVTPVSIAAWASPISAGPNESAQTVTFSVVNDNPTLFALQPVIAPDGTLSFTPNGTAGSKVL